MIGETIKVTPGPGLQIRKRGVFDLDKLYQEMTNWFGKNKYDFNEDIHSDKKGDKGKEIIIVLSGEKKVTDYIKCNIKVNFFLKNINKVSKASDNLEKGSVKITLIAKLVLDYNKKWNKSSFSSFLFKIYNNYIIKKEIGKYKNKLYKEILNLQDVAKEILELHK